MRLATRRAFTAAAFLNAFAGCAAVPAPCPKCPPCLVAPHVVTESRCAVIELQLDGGVTKSICLTASQLEKAIAP